MTRSLLFSVQGTEDGEIEMLKASRGENVEIWRGLESIINQIKSTVDLVRFLQLERRCITLSRLVRSLELLLLLLLCITVGSPEECFQAELESWHGTHQLEFCWQPIPCLRSSDRERPLTELQTGPGDDIITVGRSSKSRP